MDATDIDKMKEEILDIVENYEKKYGVRIHISGWKHDHITEKKDFIITIYNRTSEKSIFKPQQ